MEISLISLKIIQISSVPIERLHLAALSSTQSTIWEKLRAIGTLLILMDASERTRLPLQASTSLLETQSLRL